MWAFFFLWITVLVLAVSLILWRCTTIIYLIFCLPAICTFLYFIMKNNTAMSASNHKQLFDHFRIGGHRGSPMSAPENTLESIKMAKNEGCDMVEFDVHMSSDGVALLMHDDTTGRTGNKNLVVGSSTWDELSQVELKTVNQKTDKIPKLSDVVKYCIENNLKMLFDIKDNNLELLEIVAKEIGLNNIYHRVLVSSFSPTVAWRLKKIDPKIVTGITVHRTYYSFADDFQQNPFSTNIFFHWWHQILDEMIVIFSPTYMVPKFLGVDVIMMSYQLMSENAVSEAREKGFSVIGWTVNSPEYMMMMKKWGVPFLTDVSSEINSNSLGSSKESIVLTRKQ